MTEPYDVGTVTVASGGTVVTGVGTGWVGKVRKNDLFTDPSQGLFARVTSDPTENDELAINAWPGTALAGDAYEIIPSADGIDISGRLRELLFGLSLVDPNFDAQVDTLPDRAAYDDRAGPTPTARGFAVLVSDDGAGAAIYSKKSNASGDWSDRAPYSGPTGAKGWSPEFAIVADGARRVLQLTAWVGGEGTPPAGVGDYVGAGGLVDDIASALDIRGPAGDLSGVTTFWQARITVDTTAGSALTGLGFSDFIKTLIDDADAATARGTLGIVFASQAEAEAGSDNTKYMTPLRVAQAVAARNELRAGDIITTATSTRTGNVMLCNGAAVSRTTYAALFAAIGTTYGAGDGSTTFALPDYRGLFPRGLDNGRGVDPSRALGTRQTNQFASHVHGVPVVGAAGGSASFSAGGGAATTTYSTNAAGTGTETRPENISVNFWIAY